jgi:hypothetical protein
MAKLSWKAPSIETLSTSLTYIALTGALLAPLATAKPSLPPAVEARTQLPPAETPAITARATAATAPVAPPDLKQASTKSKASSLVAGGEESELQALPPAVQVAEARTRLKSVKAKDATPSTDSTTGFETKTAPPTADVRITERVEDTKAARAETSDEKTAALPSPTATVPVASPDPVNPEPATVWTDADVAAALKECLRLLAPANAEIEVNTAMRKGQCGTPAPILLKSIGANPKLTFQPAVEINCQMAVALGEWAADTLQPAARETYSSEVKSVVGASGYSCRNRYGAANERLSEHALANAIDIGGFALANGRSIKVSAGWGATTRDRAAAAKAATKPADIPADKPDDKSAKTPAIKGEKTTQRASLKTADLTDRKDQPRQTTPTVTDAKVVEVDGTSTPDGQFLRRLHKGACETFGTVLGPEANEAHRDHFHFDLKARKRRAVCQ